MALINTKSRLVTIVLIRAMFPILNNYWMRFFLTSGIIKVEVSVVSRANAVGDNTYREKEGSFRSYKDNAKL